jgi:hypothetical protein
MMVQPRAAYFGADPTTIKIMPSDWPSDLIIECEAVTPASATGRTVYLRIPRDQIPAMLKAARKTAIAARSTPERPVAS